VTRVVWWIGDQLDRRERHPGKFFAASFLILWIGVALGPHFIPRWYGGSSQGFVLSWGGATFTALCVPAIGTLLVYVLFWRPRD
jgi:hypothetical protein